MLGLFTKKQKTQQPSIADEIIKYVEGIERMKNPPKTIDVIFMPNGKTHVRGPMEICYGGEMYTYELKPKGGPERC